MHTPRPAVWRSAHQQGGHPRGYAGTVPVTAALPSCAVRAPSFRRPCGPPPVSGLELQCLVHRRRDGHPTLRSDQDFVWTGCHDFTCLSSQGRCGPGSREMRGVFAHDPAESTGTFTAAQSARKPSVLPVDPAPVYSTAHSWGFHWSSPTRLSWCTTRIRICSTSSTRLLRRAPLQSARRWISFSLIQETEDD